MFSEQFRTGTCIAAHWAWQLDSSDRVDASQLMPGQCGQPIPQEGACDSHSSHYRSNIYIYIYSILSSKHKYSRAIVSMKWTSLSILVQASVRMKFDFPRYNKRQQSGSIVCRHWRTNDFTYNAICNLWNLRGEGRDGWWTGKQWTNKREINDIWNCTLPKDLGEPI